MGLSFLGVWEVAHPRFRRPRQGHGIGGPRGGPGGLRQRRADHRDGNPLHRPAAGPRPGLDREEPGLLDLCRAALRRGLAWPAPICSSAPSRELIRFLPKPGAWMDTFKQLMGFVLMGTVVYILYFARVCRWSCRWWGLLFGLWAACWWIGRLSPLADAGAKVRAWLEAAAFTADGLDLHVHGHQLSPHRRVSPRDPRPGRGRCATTTITKSAWRPLRFRRPGSAEKPAGPATVLVDFTADWCLTCKLLEATVLDSPAVVEAVRRHGVVTLQADWTHEPPRSPRCWRPWGPARMCRWLAIFPARDPNHPLVIAGPCTQQTLLDALKEATAK